MRAHDVQRDRHVAEERREHPPSDQRMDHDVLVLLLRETPRLVQYCFADADLADVVHVPTELDLPHDVIIETQSVSNDR